MTRPIYEPTPARADAYLDFQQQQLFRRPAVTPGAIYTDMSIAARRFHAPNVMVGIPTMYYNQPTSGIWDNLPWAGFAIWPGGLVVQALWPFGEIGTTENSDVHLAPQANKQTQNAANKAAAAVSFEFTAEEAGLDVSGYTQYEAIFVFKCSGTANDLHIDWDSPSSISGTWNHEVTVASDHWGNDYYGLRGLSFVEYSPSPGDLHQIKVWFEGAGSTAWCAAIYWLPIASLAVWSITDAIANDWEFDLSDAGGNEGATATFDSSEANYEGHAIVDTQQVDGPLDPAYTVSLMPFGEIRSSWNYWDSSDSSTRYTLAPTHEYIEGRIGADVADEGFLNGFITRYDNAMPDTQAYIGTRNWGLVYMGMRPRWRGHTNQFGLWRPDPAGTMFPFVDSLGDDIRSGASFRFLDFLTPQYDAEGARIAFNQFASGAPYIT